MLKRFSLYGFLKNQRYFEPFLLLFLLEKGISFTEIGILVGFREICRNFSEIPSGVLADLYGRRRSMIFSFTSYIASFLIFGFSNFYWQLFFAMFFFALGDAFRTGTHKAMIFTWLKLNNRTEERSKVYGYTRSWSKIGSAVSILLATIFVIYENNYTSIFFYSVIPYVFGLINFITYPKELDGLSVEKPNLTLVFNHLWESLKKVVKFRKLRNLVFESISFEGVFTTTKDYIQPIVQNFALAIPFLLFMDNKGRTAVIIGIVYFILYILSAFASRNSHKIAEHFGGEYPACKKLWYVDLAIYTALIPFLFFELYLIAIILFILLFVLQNVWRPLLISRFDDFATEQEGATILSIESQAQSTSAMIFAPLVGFAVDTMKDHSQSGEFWPIGLLGASLALIIILFVNKAAK
ncbi:MAG: MFS transporter [Bacteroidota bacterium]